MSTRHISFLVKKEMSSSSAKQMRKIRGILYWKQHCILHFVYGKQLVNLNLKSKRSLNDRHCIASTTVPPTWFTNNTQFVIRNFSSASKMKRMNYLLIILSFENHPFTCTVTSFHSMCLNTQATMSSKHLFRISSFSMYKPCLIPV